MTTIQIIHLVYHLVLTAAIPALIAFSGIPSSRWFLK